MPVKEAIGKGILNHYSVVRHICNRSKGSWRIYLGGSVGVEEANRGAQYEGNPEAEKPDRRSWLLPPGSFLKIRYYLSDNPCGGYGEGSGKITIQDCHTGDWNTYGWLLKGDLIIGAWSGTLKIYHKGRTPAMNLNHPARGDIDIFARAFYPDRRAATGLGPLQGNL